ncbi:MAG TPA: tripartite tricarboxylate transporter substrate binding protein [Burkholderiaceae bacterium]
MRIAVHVIDRRAVLRRLGAASLVLGQRVAWADDSFPNKPIRVVPFGTAGGPIDAIARSYGEALKQRWNQPVIVDAKPGASGIVAADFVAKAPPDGYTLMLTLSLTHTTVPLLQQKVPYDPVRDFLPLSKVATGGPMFVVPASAPPNDLKAFVDWAKAKGRVTYGTWGNGSSAHLFGELFKRQTGAPMDHVPYKGEAAAHLDMFGGVLDAAWANPATARTHLQAGKIKVLGIIGSRRVGTIPTVPTFTEQGFDGFALDSWMGFFAPARTPPTVAEKLTAALREITQSPELRTKLLDMGFEPAGTAADTFANDIKTQYPVWAGLVKAAGVVPE